MRVFTAFAAAVAIFFIFYLLGAFVAVSFDISEWAEVGRFIVAVVGGIISAFTFTVVIGT